VAAIPEIEELNIGHSIVSRAVMAGMRAAVEEMLHLVRSAGR
jgi:pyridoxine 5-phosphate synthase